MTFCSVFWKKCIKRIHKIYFAQLCVTDLHNKLISVVVQY